MWDVQENWNIRLKLTPNYLLQENVGNNVAKKSEKMKKVISIKKTLISKIIKSFLISLLLFFILEHFGEFEFKVYPMDRYVVYNTLTTNKIYSDRLFFSDVEYPESGYFETYSEKFPYYFKATLEDYNYILLLTILLTLLFIMNEKFKFKLD